MNPQLRLPFPDKGSLDPHPDRHPVTIGQDARAPTLYVRESSEYVALTDDEVLNHARRLLELNVRPGRQVLQTPTATRDFLRFRLSRLDYEVFGCLYLDTRLALIEMEELFRGTLDEAAVYPREVVKAAIRHGARSVIVYHNHPSGVAEPSAADENITKRLRQALAVIEVTLLDHLIVGDLVVYSFSDHGLL
jgi:DNA repair protein RadC